MINLDIKYTLIGNGRVATHFAHYFDLLDLPYYQWSRDQSISELHKVLKQSSHVLLLISDDAIDAFIEKHLANDKILVHFSGALQSNSAWTAHPLQTFSKDLYTLEHYQALPFIIEEQGPAFLELLPGLPNEHGTIKRDQKPLYHAMCAMANNFSTLLWQKLFYEFKETFQLKSDFIYPILQQTTENLKNNHQTALTGPLMRNDKITLQKHLNALEDDSFKEIYTAFINSYETTHE